MKKIISALVFVATVLGLIYFLSYAYNVVEQASLSNSITPSLESTTTSPTPVPDALIVMPASVVLQKIQTSGELVLVQMETMVNVSVAQPNEPLALLGWDLYRPADSQVFLLAKGVVRAGYSPTGIEATVDIATNSLTLKLPVPKIYSYDFNPDTSQLEFRTVKEISVVTIGAIAPETVEQANQLARELSLQDACARNIYFEVNTAALDFFKDWFGQVYDEVVVTTTDGTCQ